MSLTKTELLSGEWFRVTPGKYPPTYRRLYKFKPAAKAFDGYAGYLVVLGDGTDQTEYHAQVKDITDTNITLCTFLLHEIVEITFSLTSLERVISKEIFKKD